MDSHYIVRPRRSRSSSVVLLQAASLLLLPAFSLAQGFLPCPSAHRALTVRNTSDIATLASSLQCSNGSFSVLWYGDVVVSRTISITQGTSLNITGADTMATADGNHKTQLFAVEDTSSLHIADMALVNGHAVFGGAVVALDQANVSFGGRTTLESNTATYGGAIYTAESSTVFWDGGKTTFRTNNASQDGGAIFAGGRSAVSWDGDTDFTRNVAFKGGAVFAHQVSHISWRGSTTFNKNDARFGGAIMAESSVVSWAGETAFEYNTAGTGGAALLYNATRFSWTGTTMFVENSASGDGGGLALDSECVVAWGGNTVFESNKAVGVGGGLHALTNNDISWTGVTSFIGNIAGDKAGAMFISESVVTWMGDTAFTDNVAHRHGGAIYAIVSSRITCQGTTVFFRNSATTGEGGALSLYGSWSGESSRVNITGVATFTENFAFATGGAIFSSANAQGHYFENVTFQTNSAGIGGAVGSYDNGDDEKVFPVPTVYSKCQFIENLASSSGLAVTVFDSLVTISDTSFDGNGVICPEGEYPLEAPKEGAGTTRYDKVCDGCPSWEECQGCTVSESNFDPICSTALEHTSANKSGTTLETLSMDEGYWRTSTQSSTILACYNADACLGGQTGSDTFCIPGYMGPYCSMCQSGYSLSQSRTCTRCTEVLRKWSLAITLVAGGVLFCMMAVFVNNFMSTGFEEQETTYIERLISRRIPLQAFKNVIIVWQILTQFASVANVIYPGVYQIFLSGLDIINLDVGFLLSAGCLWRGIDFHDRLLVGTIWPLGVLGLLAWTYDVAMTRNCRCGDRVREKIRNRHVSAVIFVLFFVYSSTSSTVFQAFACDSLDDGKQYLRADYRILCTGPKHRALQVYAVFMVAVYPVGIPLLFAVLLDRYCDVLSDPGADKTAAQAIASLWAPYRPNRFFYEIIEYGRRIMLTGVVVFIYPGDTAQIAITIVSAFFFFVVSEVLSPYQSASDTWLSRSGHILIFFSMFDVLLLRVDVSQESSDSQQVLAGVLVTGHVLMIVAVLAGAIGAYNASRRPVIVVEEEGPSHAYLRRPPMGMGQEGVETEHTTQVFWRAKMTVELGSQ